MGIFSKVFKTATVGAAAAGGTFYALTFRSKFVPFDPADPILGSAAFKKYNPISNPTMSDLCVRRVPIEKIDPELLQSEGKLVEAFCGGVWSGYAYDYQRRYLAKKYQGPGTAHQLWTRRALQRSSYDVGTQITDHFEVVSKTASSIVVRCGDSPLKRDVRESDGLFEMSAVVLEGEGVVEFGLKSVFFQGLKRIEGRAVPWHIEVLHRYYTKLLMEAAIYESVLR